MLSPMTPRARYCLPDLYFYLTMRRTYTWACTKSSTMPLTELSRYVNVAVGQCTFKRRRIVLGCIPPPRVTNEVLSSWSQVYIKLTLLHLTRITARIWRFSRGRRTVPGIRLHIGILSGEVFDEPPSSIHMVFRWCESPVLIPIVAFIILRLSLFIRLIWRRSDGGRCTLLQWFAENISRWQKGN